MMLAPRGALPAPLAAGTGRLALVVPYRNRAEHLAKFVPHIVTFFERDLVARTIPYAIHVVEQADDRPFNGGALKNAGFALAHAEADTVCFHDVDYLPMWADYTPVEAPTGMITFGIDGSPDATQSYGCVVAFPVDDFVRVDGYSNEYAGWGFEDSDIAMRVRRAGLRWLQRDGTFLNLPHPHHGLTPEGELNEAAQRNRARFKAKVQAGQIGNEGLSTLGFRVLRTERWMRNGVPQEHVLHHHVAW
jgi:N-terminal region of glycosyl transferase group 7/N-terminal domain of galactosyltransferase